MPHPSRRYRGNNRKLTPGGAKVKTASRREYGRDTACRVRKTGAKRTRHAESLHCLTEADLRPQGGIEPKRSLGSYALMKPSFLRLFRRFSLTMEPYCALKVPKHLFKNQGYYHHNINDRFWL